MPTETLLDRFLHYVQVNTQSDPTTGTTPSSPGQWDLLHMLAHELRELGAQDVTVTEHGYVMATLPATVEHEVPTVAFFAHVDTTPDFPGEGVKPIVHRAWDGKPIVLPDDPRQILDPALYPELQAAVGKDIVTASGLTLLGADDKAGVAVVMTFAAHLLAHPELPHGPIRICFNPDEEIGHGVDKLDLDLLGADVAYTLDGEHPGEVNWETFSGDSAVITIEGVSTHPGWARAHGMVNAVHMAGKLLAALPREAASPEVTDGRQGYLHPIGVLGTAAKTELRFILRAFDDAELAMLGERLKALAQGLQGAEPRCRITWEITPSYRNMGNWLRGDLTPVDLAYEAMRELGLTPSSPPIRGGTDGSRLTERGLPTPNLFDGGHNWHGPLEWVAVQDMQLAVEACLRLARLWAEKGAGYQRAGR
jgi:tripeptide aminopeptidase